MMVLPVSPETQRARDQWRWTGRGRPEFAESPKPGQVSVWDFPRPPQIEIFEGSLRVELAGEIVAETTRGVRVCETAGAPTYYFPPADVGKVRQMRSIYHCEWKGLSAATSTGHVADAGWVLIQAYPEFAGLIGWHAFYPRKLTCFVNDELVRPQPGGYYGGWVTNDLAGPIKGGPESGGW